MQFCLDFATTAKMCRKCVPDVYRNMPADLAQVVAAWENIDVETRRKIVAMIGQE